MAARYAMTKAETTAFRAGRVIGHDSGKREAAAQLEQARRWAAALEAQLAFATELRIPKQDGDEIVILRHGANADQWSIKDGGRAFRAWVNGQWRQLSDISLDDTVTYPLHEALDIARQLANGDAPNA
ncbi:hypothetical protein ACWY4P_40560 [Streptomyces sp. LZ34]